MKFSVEITPFAIPVQIKTAEITMNIPNIKHNAVKHNLNFIFTKILFVGV